METETETSPKQESKSIGIFKAKGTASGSPYVLDDRKMHLEDKNAL